MILGGRPIGSTPLAGSGSTGNVGTVTGRATVSGVGRANAQSKGTISGHATLSGVGAGAVFGVGAISGNATVTGVGRSVRYAQFRLGWTNGVTIGTLTASTAESQLPVTNLANGLGNAASGWQTTDGSLTSQWFRVDCGATLAIDMCAIFRTNLTTGATVRFRIFSDAGFSSAVYDSGTVSATIQPGFGQSVLLLPTTSGRYCQVDLSDASNPDNHLNVPQAYIGPLVGFQLGYSQASQISLDTGNVTVTSKFGQTIVNQYWTARKWSVSLQEVRSDEWSTLQDLDIASRSGVNVIFVPNVGAPTAILNREPVLGLCEFSSGIGFSAKSVDARSVSLAVTERL